MYRSTPTGAAEKTTNYMAEIIPQVDEKELEVPTLEEHPQLLEKAHLLGHFGADVIVQRIFEDEKRWPNMKVDAVEYVRRCIPCQQYKIIRHGFHPL